ncbi:tetratricopeptide repeat-containing sensor histidine kinase [Tenacibaculum sp. M341]|uniref:tetratricopeptide repeat-containing sensor histidine kinase n=1 Tax=Tenacibaculum sp. M341 TaxID=2530339 RepID=UPI001404DE82|nr:tetratricopeptide repeat-containing sensor histidine kinase [Tenacibaculum sp. M341]
MGDSETLIKEKLIEDGRKAFFEKKRLKLKKITFKIDSIFNISQDSLLLAKYYHFRALQCKLSYQNDSAFYYYHQSKNISKKTNDSLPVGRRLLSLAVLQRNAKDYLGSEISSIEALEYLEPKKTKEPKELYKYLNSVYNNLGLISNELSQKEDAIRFYNKALEINKLNKNDEGYLYTINNIGLFYQKINKNKIAIEYFNKGLSFDSLSFKYPRNYVLLLENLAASKFLLGKREGVIISYEKVLKIKKRIKDNWGLSTTHVNLCDYHKRFKNFSKAKYHANEALKYAKLTHNNQRWLEALQLLSDLTTGKESKTYLQEYITLNDSLVQQERQLKNQFAKIRYETGKKEKENAFLKTENEKKEAEIAYQKQQTTIGWLGAAVSILLFFISVSFFTFRRKKILYQAQLQKAQVRERERRRIAKSLHDEVAGDLRLLHTRLEKSQMIEEAQKLDMVKENVRNLSHQLSSISFKKVNFIDQMINLVSDYFAPGFVIKIHNIKDIDWSKTNRYIKRLLYLSTRESIQNCKKYAEASKVDINFSVRKKYVFLSISDNGVGFDINTCKKGIGLQNMQERVEELNGTLAIKSELGKGTKIEIQVPLNAK